MSAMIALLVAAVCPPQQLPPARFTPGEVLQYKLDVVGADVGTVEVRTEPPPAAEKEPAVALLTVRAKASAFMSTNVGRYESFATALIARDLSPLRYREDVDDGNVHRGIEMAFPPRNGSLTVNATKNGEPEPYTLVTGESVRDLFSALYLARFVPLNQAVCLQVVAMRKLWKLTGRMSARETIETPVGRFQTLRFEGEAVRVDDPKIKRAAFVWVTDDERRLPLSAIGDVRGKTIRAQLVSAPGLRRAARK